MNDILESRKKEISLDLTSLIDIIFLLLVFFMLTTTFDKLGGAKIDLPQSSLTEVKQEKNKVMLLIGKNMKIEIRIEGKDIKKNIISDEKKLKQDLKTIIKNFELKDLSIVSDEKIEYGYIIKMIEIAKLSGFESVNLETIKK
jgi:biopolymer transport protein ExbD